MTTLQEEAMSLVGLLPNSQRYSEKLNQLLAAKAEAETAIANLKLQEKASAEAMTSKLQAQEKLLGMLQGETDQIETARAAAAAKLAAAEADLARREAAFDEAKQAHADQVEHDLRNCAFREEAIARKEAELGAVAEARVKDLHSAQAALRDQHKGLRATIAEARQGLAAAIAA